MKKEYDELLGISSVILTKGVDCTLSQVTSVGSKPPYHIVYAGKLSYGRDETLVALSKAIQHVNQDRQTFILDIYSQSTPSDSAMKDLNCEGCSVFHGAVAQSEVNLVLQRADILLIAEALEGKHKNISRLSFSTKVTDCLSKGKCVLLIAPKDNATTEYLQENQAAVVVSSSIDMERQLQKLKKDPAIMNIYAARALQLVQSNHSIQEIQRKLFSAIADATEHN